MVSAFLMEELGFFSPQTNLNHSSKRQASNLNTTPRTKEGATHLSICLSLEKIELDIGLVTT